MVVCDAYLLHDNPALIALCGAHSVIALGAALSTSSAAICVEFENSREFVIFKISI